MTGEHRYALRLVERCLARSKRHGTLPFGLVRLDFEAAGNGLARRVEGLIRLEDTLAEIGEGRFLLVLEDLHHEADCLRVVRRVQQAFPGPAGGALSLSGFVEPQEMLQAAERALKEARARGVNVLLSDPAYHRSASERLDLERELVEAFEEEKILVYYQPIVDLGSGRVTSLEALVRWAHPQRGVLLPRDFLDVAEASGAIVPISRLVLRKACRQLASWRQEFGGRDLRLSLNLSRRQFVQDGFVEEIGRALEDFDLPPQALRLEVSEDLLAHHPDLMEETLPQLKKLAIAFHLDDFGRGYSSLLHLKRFPFESIKLDRTLVSGMESDEMMEMVLTVLKIARSLELRTVAEGVDTFSVLEELRRLGCCEAQGFLFSRPLDGAAAHRLLAENPRW